RKGDHSALRVVLEGQRALRSLPVRSGLGSKDLQGFRSDDQPIESDQRGELHRSELQSELAGEVDLGSVERGRSILLAAPEELERPITQPRGRAGQHRNGLRGKGARTIKPLTRSWVHRTLSRSDCPIRFQALD